MSARSIARLVLALVALAAALGFAAPADAAETVTAEGAALNSGADCGDASLDLTLTSGDIDREYGHASVLGGVAENEFEEPSGSLDDSDSDTYEGYGIGLNGSVPDGTIIGTYAYLGVTPPTAEGTAEFFVLYRCSEDGSANEVLLTCFGDYGTCPQLADEADAPALDAPDEAETGSTVTVTGVGCYEGGEFSVAPSGGGSALAAGALEGSNGDLTFSFEMPDVPAGTELEVTATCDLSGAVGSATVAAPEAATPAPAPTPTPPAPTPAPVVPPAAPGPAPQPVVAQPAYTG